MHHHERRTTVRKNVEFLQKDCGRPVSRSDCAEYTGFGRNSLG